MLARTLLAILVSVPLIAAPDARPLLVCAAISLSDALQDVASAYTRAGHPPPRFNFAGSNVLARQIVNGAPADLFISADAAQMDYAQARSAIDPATRIDLLRNRLAVVVPAGARQNPPDAAALVRLRRIAIGDPQAVPAGVYARQYLQSIGLWQPLQPKLLPLANVRGALAAAESGGADAAIVYESDAAISARVSVAFVVTGSHAPRIVYPAAIVSRSAQRERALGFLAFLRTREARVIFEKYRFSVVGS